MKHILIAILIFSVHSVFAQYAVRGKIVDQRTQRPLAFVNIQINDNPRLGTTTDIDGNFKFESETKINTLRFSYVGYERKTISMDSVRNANRMVVNLTQTAMQLQGVTIVAGENPAHRIIRQVTANRRINNPENVRSFKYNSHNIITVDTESNDTTSRGDSLRNNINRAFRGGYLFLTETITERKFLSGRSQETILSTRTSGFREFALPFSGTDFQPFSFYEDHFQLFEVNYLNPISRGSTSRYFFNIEDTIFQGQDTVFVISFRPRTNSNINGLKGVLQINTNRYAVQNVIAEPAEPGMFNMRIEQKYVFVNDTQWFPEQLNFEISFSRLNVLDKGTDMRANVVMRGRTYIDQVELFPELRRRDFSIDQTIMSMAVKLQDSLFWAERRVVPLDSKELATYRFIDSIGEAANLDGIMMVIMDDILMQRHIPITKHLALDLSNLMVFNEFESLRLGMGLRTRERLSKHLSFGGFFGYGFRDKAWKYGGDGILNFSRKHEIDLRLNYQNTLRETGCIVPFVEHRSLANLLAMQDYRSFMASQMDQIQEISANVGFRIRFAKFNFGLSQTHVNPYKEIVFQPNDREEFTNYNYTNLNIGVRYAFRERFIRTTGRRMSLGTKFPIIQANYSRGLSGLSGFLTGDFEFNKIDFRLDQSFTWKILGESKIRMNAGWIDRPLPYGLLYTGDGAFQKHGVGLFFTPNYFQTMRKYEFLSDQYANLFLSHNFGSLFLRIGRFRPHFTVHHNMGWGRLSHPEYQQNIEFKTKDKGFYESGLQIDQLLRLNYLNMMYLGFGAGVYYRYGANAFDRTQDNFAVKLSLTFSTK